MKTRNNSRGPRQGSHNVVRGHTYTHQKWQPKRIFCMGESLTDKLDEFLWNREHAAAISRDPRPVQERVKASIEAIREVQIKRHEEALNIGGF